MKDVICVLAFLVAFAPPVMSGRPLTGLSGLRLDEVEHGEWLPLRMQPTRSPAAHFGSAALSPYNALQANKILDGLQQKKPMLLVRGPFGRLVIGRENGLIQGMRPHILSASYEGSYLREYAERWHPEGTLEIFEQSPDKIVLNWKGGDARRKITIFPHGLVETVWENGPENLELFTGCHPYHFISENGETAVRFSQLLQSKRKLEGRSNFALFGYRNASLEIKAKGLKSRSEEIWLDAGEIGWEWAIAYAKEHPQEQGSVHDPFFAFMREHAALTYLAGGAVRRMIFAAEKSRYELDYRIDARGKSALTDLKATTFKHKTMQQNPPGLVRVKTEKLWTWRIWPNAFNGWELRPLKRVHINPMPAFYEMTLRNDSDAERSFTFQLDKAAWMESAMLESDKRIMTLPDSLLQAPKYRQQSFWIGQRDPEVTVPAGKEQVVLLRLKPLEETLGAYDFAVTWSAGRDAASIPLTLAVVPNIIVDPYGNPGLAPEDYRYFGCTARTLDALYFDWYYRTPNRATQDEFLDLRGQQGLRNGTWGWVFGFLREYVGAWSGNRKSKPARSPHFALPPDEFVVKLADDHINRAAHVPYRYRVHLADEIWEILGGYKDQRWMPVEELARMVYDLIMDCPNPCQFSFMVPGIDDQYHVKIPNDIAELFYYCGRDEGFRTYVEKLVKPRTELFREWGKDPVLMKRAGTDKPRQIFSFWISGMLHVTDYESMRRQHWYTRYHGIDGMMMYAFLAEFMIYGNSGIGCNNVMGVARGNAVRDDRGLAWHDRIPQGSRDVDVIMTDRSLAWYDLREDMALITLVRLLKERAGRATLGEVESLERQAYLASQRNEFDLARHHLLSAVKTMNPKHAELVCPDFYQPITSQPLADLFKHDRELSQRPDKKKVTVGKLKGGRRPAPVLDGELDNSYLEEGATLNDFRQLNSYEPAEAPTTAYLAWDDQSLYVLFVCSEPMMDKLKADPDMARDGPAYKMDCVELFVSRNTDNQAYSHFVVSAGGTRYDGRTVEIKKAGESRIIREVKQWDPDWFFVVTKGKANWTAELRIPMSVLGGSPEPGDVWAVNFTRERQTKKELLSWSPMEISFHVTSQYGQIKFAR